jgi:hypothetical protein
MKGGGCRLDSGRRNSRAGVANNSSRTLAKGIAAGDSLMNKRTSKNPDVAGEIVKYEQVGFRRIVRR